MTWFGWCMASAAWLSFGLLLLFAPGWWNLTAVPTMAVGVGLGYRAYLEDLRG